MYQLTANESPVGFHLLVEVHQGVPGLLLGLTQGGSCTASATGRTDDSCCAGDEPGVQVGNAADGLALLADAIVLGQVGSERERGAGNVVERLVERVPGLRGHNVQDDVGARARSGREQVVIDEGIEIVGGHIPLRHVAEGDARLVQRDTREVKTVVFVEVRQVPRGSGEQGSLGPIAQSLHNVRRDLLELSRGGVD
jgi:hypothetical protein